jgi:hypothetical protein
MFFREENTDLKRAVTDLVKKTKVIKNAFGYTKITRKWWRRGFRGQRTR